MDHGVVVWWSFARAPTRADELADGIGARAKDCGRRSTRAGWGRKIVGVELLVMPRLSISSGGAPRSEALELAICVN